MWFFQLQLNIYLQNFSWNHKPYLKGIMYFREYALTNESKSPNQYIFSNILNFTQKRILKTNYSEKKFTSYNLS